LVEINSVPGDATRSGNRVAGVIKLPHDLDDETKKQVDGIMINILDNLCSLAFRFVFQRYS
jgi:hypothetical protein